MEILVNVWIAFNTIFGLWTARNLVVRVWSVVTCRKYLQSSSGKIIDLFVLVSCLSFWLTFH